MQFINAEAHSPLWAHRQPVLDWGLGNSYKVPVEYPAKPIAGFVKTFWLFYPPKTQTKLFLVYKVSNYCSCSCPLSIKSRMKQYSKLDTRKHSKTVLDTHPMLVYWEDYENLVPFFLLLKNMFWFQILQLTWAKLLVIDNVVLGSVQQSMKYISISTYLLKVAHRRVWDKGPIFTNSLWFLCIR